MPGRADGGYALWTGSDGKRQELATFTCSHCQRVIFVQPRQDPASLGGFCRQCMKHICGGCVNQGVCTPWEKQMEKMERRSRMLKAMGAV